jgi:hypothetical protein
MKIIKFKINILIIKLTIIIVIIIKLTIEIKTSNYLINLYNLNQKVIIKKNKVNYNKIILKIILVI